LQRDEALAAARRLVRVAEEAGGALDVLDDELLVRLLDRGAAAGQCRDGLLVAAGPREGRVEDRGGRGEPREPDPCEERAQRAVASYASRRRSAARWMSSATSSSYACSTVAPRRASAAMASW